MGKIVELHLIQSFAPSCLNRDDTGAPKDCLFGGSRRARVSSQCFKRAIREYALTSGIDPKSMGTRTRRLCSIAAERLVKEGRSEEEVRRAAKALLSQLFSKENKDLSDKKDPQLTQYLLFCSSSEIDAFVEMLDRFWDELTSDKMLGDPQESEETPVEAETAESKTGKSKKKGSRKGEVSPELKEAIKKFSNLPCSFDVALFGRMVADKPEFNIDGCCQVAHAISTHAVNQEMDFFTALDDLKPDDISGSEMMGVVEFNSACFYRYLSLDWSGLEKKLGHEKALEALEIFLRAVVLAIPSGKQNTFAAHNLPSLSLAMIHEGQRFSLANAFETPLVSRKGLIEGSIRKLNEHVGTLEALYGSSLAGKGSQKFFFGFAQEPEATSHLGTAKGNLDEWVQAVRDCLDDGR